MSEYLQSEQPAIELFKKLGYEHFNAKGQMYEVVLKERLDKSIRRINPWLSENSVQKVVKKIVSVDGSSLMEINAEIHRLISRADAYSWYPTPSQAPRAVKFIDYENLENNDFLIVNQMKFKDCNAVGKSLCLVLLMEQLL